LDIFVSRALFALAMDAHAAQPELPRDLPHDLHDFKRHVRVYIAVFCALLFGTLATVAAWKWGHFSTLSLTIAVALFIACVKAFLVAAFFMHLISERKAIYAVLAATVIFFAGMMCLTVWSRGQTPHGTEYNNAPAQPVPLAKPER
jgi:cytochrome c oxidase subunit IV